MPAMNEPTPTPWTACGAHLLQRNASGWLVPTDAYWRLWLERPELALVEASCAGERALHAALVASPLRTVQAHELDAIQDADVRANVRLFLGFRDTVQAAGSLEAAYAGFVNAVGADPPRMFVGSPQNDTLLVSCESDWIPGGAGDDIYWVNGSGVKTSAPFGGVKQSGFGRMGGRFGLEDFQRPKNVYIPLG